MLRFEHQTKLHGTSNRAPLTTHAARLTEPEAEGLVATLVKHLAIVLQAAGVVHHHPLARLGKLAVCGTCEAGVWEQQLRGDTTLTRMAAKKRATKLLELPSKHLENAKVKLSTTDMVALPPPATLYSAHLHPPWPSTLHTHTHTVQPIHLRPAQNTQESGASRGDCNWPQHNCNSPAMHHVC